MTGLGSCRLQTFKRQKTNSTNTIGNSLIGSPRLHLYVCIVQGECVFAIASLLSRGCTKIVDVIFLVASIETVDGCRMSRAAATLVG